MILKLSLIYSSSIYKSHIFLLCVCVCVDFNLNGIILYIYERKKLKERSK